MVKFYFCKSTPYTEGNREDVFHCAYCRVDQPQNQRRTLEYQGLLWSKYATIPRIFLLLSPLLLYETPPCISTKHALPTALLSYKVPLNNQFMALAQGILYVLNPTERCSVLFCLIFSRNHKQLIQNQFYLHYGWVLQLLVNLQPCVSVEFQCILTSNEFRSKYSSLAFLPQSEARIRHWVSRTASYAHSTLLNRVLVSTRISINLSPAVSYVFLVWFDKVDESTADGRSGGTGPDHT